MAQIVRVRGRASGGRRGRERPVGACCDGRGRTALRRPLLLWWRNMLVVLLLLLQLMLGHGLCLFDTVLARTHTHTQLLELGSDPLSPLILLLNEPAVIRALCQPPEADLNLKVHLQRTDCSACAIVGPGARETVGQLLRRVETMEWCGRVRGIVCVGVEGVGTGRDGRQGWWHAASAGGKLLAVLQEYRLCCEMGTRRMDPHPAVRITPPIHISMKFRGRGQCVLNGTHPPNHEQLGWLTTCPWCAYIG
jgi:hypothetical protein